MITNIENILQPETITFVKDVGFPIASFIIMVSILMYVMKRDEIRQEKSEYRYEKLVDKFIETIRQISEQHERAMENMADEIKDMTTELKVIATKIDTCTRRHESSKNEIIDHILTLRDK